MVTMELLVRLEAKPGMETKVECFLSRGLPVVQEEPAMTALFAIRLAPSTFGNSDIFDYVAALRTMAAEIFTQPLIIEHVDALAATHPE
jgi:hypothetical protein